MKNTQLLFGECLDKLTEISDDSVDMIMADLPYGTTACKWDSIIPLEPLWKELKRVTTDNSAMVFTAQQPFTTALAASNLNDFRYEWIWEKPQGTNPMNAKVMPLKSHENILVFYKKKLSSES
jgi:site-specific DNA-methyltransferase (adenine-specific)